MEGDGFVGRLAEKHQFVRNTCPWSFVDEHEVACEVLVVNQRPRSRQDAAAVIRAVDETFHGDGCVGTDVVVGQPCFQRAVGRRVQSEGHMAGVVEQLAVVNRILKIQSERWIVADVKGYVVLEGNGFCPNGSTVHRRRHHDRHVLEQQVVNALRSLAGVECKGVGRVDEFNGHPRMHHVGHVHAATVVQGAKGQGKCSTHRGVLNRRVLTVVGPPS